ncbi:MAG: hypothetical protein Kow0010_21470 [Dehalococcoidia bacterium]
MTPRVSVIIPTKDRCELLDLALASVRRLDGPDLDLEVLVCDNGSTDDTESVARRHGARFVQTLVPGAAAARNAGLRAATGDYIAFLDDDDTWAPGHLRPHLALLEADPGLGGVVGRVQLVDRERTPFGQPGPETMPGNGRYFRPFLRHYPQIGATVVRASVRETVGYLDEALLGDEDWDWHLRLALRHRLGFVPVTSVHFLQRGPATRSELEWERYRFFRRAFWRNVRRAGRERPRALTVARIYLRHAGGYYHHFAETAAACHRAGDSRGARQWLRRAFLASPAHAARDALRASPLRAALPAIYRRNAGQAEPASAINS